MKTRRMSYTCGIKFLGLRMKGQAFTADFVVATIIFMIVLALVTYLWDDTISRIDVREDIHEMEWLSSNVMEQLVRSEGFPSNWYMKPENVTVIGLVDSGLFGTKLERVLDADKLMQLINLTTRDYTLARNRLLKTGKYDFYMEISCLNSSNRDCLDGLGIDKFSEGSVTGLNGFVLGVNNQYTDSYIWREAEDYDIESGTNPESDPGMSGGAGITIPTKDEWLSYDIDISTPNEYWVLTRYDSGGGNIGIDISIDGITSSETYTRPAGFVWKKSTSSFMLGEGRYTLVINRTTPAGAPVTFDAIIITSSPDYVPENTADKYYGNFHLINPTTCIIGNYTEFANSTHVVSTTRTATFSGNLNSTIRLKLTMWSGTAVRIPVTTTVTTTTIPAGALFCNIFTSGSCSGEVGDWTCIFSLWQPTNSHAGSCGYGARDICCKVPGEQLTTAIKDGCNAEEGGVISMKETSNSHVEEYDTGSYQNDVCLGIDGGEMDCGIYSGSCPTEGNYGNVSSLYSTSNSHAAGFDEYNNKICCNVTQIPTTTTTTTLEGTTTSTTSSSTTTTVPALGCSIKSSCAGGETCIFTMYDTTNAHGANCSGTGAYNNKVCCSAGSCTIDCTFGTAAECTAGGYDEDVLSLYAGTNAHGGYPGVYSTDKKICCKLLNCGTSSLSCQGENPLCTEGRTCLASLKQTSNSHIGSCEVYDNDICCEIV